MKKFALLFMCLFSVWTAGAQNFPQTAPRNYFTDSIATPRYRPWLAAGEAFGVNMLVWSFNRYITDVDFARINMHTIQDNFKTGPIWDTDKFSTNLVAHPYHGSLYFNAARTNGMNFWQSIPFTVGGSFMWEFFMEAEPPSINDLFATSFGGVALGEITYRLSDLFIDERATGAERVGREILSGVLSPVRAFNRLITGDAWRRSTTKQRALPSVPINFILNAGPRFLADREQPEDGIASVNLSIRLDYGDPYHDDSYSPYEWFQFRAGIDLFSSQPLVSQVSVIGALWGKAIWEKKDRHLTWGIFQHFDYYDSDMKSKNEEGYVAPYRISQAAAAGPGFIYIKQASPEDKVDIYAEFYVNAVALGASVSDYMKLEERDYNLGSGYNIKAFTGITYNKRWNFLLNLENYHLFTWKGYDPELDFETVNLERLNVQGDKGNARLTIFSTHFAYYSPKRWNITLTNRYFSRHTRYKHYDNVATATSDVILSVGFRI